MKWEEKEKKDIKKVVCGDWEMWIHDTWVMLFNNTLFAIPSCSSGENEQKAFRNFLTAIAEYRGKLDKAEAGIRQILAENNNEEEVKNG